MSEDEEKKIGVDELVAAIDERWSRWKRPLILTLGFVGLLALYVFVYPVLILIFMPSDLPDWFNDGMEKTVYPLMWLDENFRPYTLYIEWLGVY
ncbi:MAG: hypothetical protein ACKVJU_02295 [Verrucomicrobiales bacterium]